MPPRRKSNEHVSRDRDQNAGTPTEQDEADILAEVGAEPDEETGELVIDETAMREVGAVDATSVRENRRLKRVVEKKRAGGKDVPWNTRDPMVMYDALLRAWTPDSIDISIKRLVGGAQDMIVTRPVNGAALYETFKLFHGQHAEAEYEIKFTGGGQYRGNGRITMPDTRAPPQQGQQTMQYYPNGNGVGAPQQWQPQVQPPQAAPAAQPIAPQATDPIAMMRQMFEMFQTMSQRPVVAAQPAPAMAPAPQVMPTDPMAMMKQMFELFQQTQGGVVPPPAPQPVVVAAPAPAPQPSIDPMAMMSQMFDMFQKMQSSMAPRPSPMQRSYAPQDGEPRPPYARPAYSGQPPPQAQQRPPTMAETFRESISVVRSAVDMMQEMEGVLPGREQQESNASPEDDDSPVRVIDTGHAKLVVNKTDGSTRLWETGVANMDKIFKWVGEQREAIQKESHERQARQQQPRQQLPPGYVEVGPDYQPPPGYRAVAVEQSDLPPPPEHVPPPIQEQPTRQAWGAPTIPSEEPYEPE